MTVEIYFTRDSGTLGFFTVKGDSKEEIRDKVGKEMKKRGLGKEKNKMIAREVTEDINIDEYFNNL